MFFWNTICATATLCLLIGRSGTAQTKTQASKNPEPPIQKVLRYPPIIPISNLPRIIRREINPSTQSLVLPYTEPGIFCKLEKKLEKTVALPFRFRVGSLAQCNYYEGKK